MLELKRPLNGLKKNNYGFQDVSLNADNTFKVTDLSDKFLLGKNSFKLHLKDDILVLRSQVYIDIVDSFGNPVYYKIISDNLPNKERIVAVYVYDSTPVGDCEIIIAGRLAINPKTGLEIPYSNDVSSPDYHGIPNVVWRKVVQINPQESEDKIYYSTPPTITYSEVRRPQYVLSTENRLTNLVSTSSGKVTMYSNRGQLTTTDTLGIKAGHLLNSDTGSATFIPISPIANGNEIASLYFTGFTLSSSMEGGMVYINNIPYSYPRDAAVTQSKTLNYSGSIVRVVNENLCYVNPPLYQVIPYTDTSGNSQNLVVNNFFEVSNFTASFRSEPGITVNSSSYDSYIRLQISNTEPDIGSVKSVNVRAKQINKPGKVVDLGTYKVEKKNLLVADSFTMTSKAIEPLSLGNFRKLGTPTNYWTGSNTIGFATDFTNDPNILDGAKFPSTEYTMQSERDYAEFRLKPAYYPSIYAGTEYLLSFDLLFQDKPNLVVPRQVDVYISGSEISTNTKPQTATMVPMKSSRFGTYIGSIDTSKTSRHSPKFYFTAGKSGMITPVFVNRSMSNIYGNIELYVRNEPGYSSNFLELEVPLPLEFTSKAELELDVTFLNSRNEPANYKSILYGVVFQGNTPILPPGSVSGSDQLTSSYDGRYELRGNSIVSSSNQITQFGFVLTSSINPFTGSVNTRLNDLEAKTGSYATTGSNQFNGNQSISGSLTISNSLIVSRATGSFSGSFSGQYSSSQQVNYDQITNKPNIIAPGQYRVLTSDGTPSGSKGNADFAYVSSSSVNRVRVYNMSQIEQSVSSSFWSTEITYITQSMFSVNNANTNIYIDLPIFKDNENFLAFTASNHHAAIAVEVKMHIYAYTGSLSSPKNTYSWASTTQFRMIQHPALPGILGTTAISGIASVSSSQYSGIGGYGTTFSGRADINSWHSVAGVSDLANGSVQFRANLAPSSSAFWTALVSTICKVQKHEIRV